MSDRTDVKIYDNWPEVFDFINENPFNIFEFISIHFFQYYFSKSLFLNSNTVTILESIFFIYGYYWIF